MRALAFIPRSLASDPERMLINTACVLIGLSVLLINPTPGGSVMAHWPHWFRTEWALSMAGGGMAALIGLPTKHWALERLGVLLIAMSSVVYAFGLFTIFWPRGVFTALIFLGIAGAKTVRFIVSSAARARLVHPPASPEEPDESDEDH